MRFSLPGIPSKSHTHKHGSRKLVFFEGYQTHRIPNVTQTASLGHKLTGAE